MTNDNYKAYTYVCVHVDLDSQLNLRYCINHHIFLILVIDQMMWLVMKEQGLTAAQDMLANS